MKIALAQINSTIGDFEGNSSLILAVTKRAQQLDADLCVFPEQCIPGYPAHDLLERSRFIEGNLNALNEIARNITGIAIIVGYAEPDVSNPGKGLFNSAALIQDGRIKSIHRKSLLPTYDVFDEQRYFEPANEVKIAEINGFKFGITICEDAWNDPDFWSKRLYNRDPIRELVDKNAEFVINLAASPFTLEKRHLRRRMLSAAAKHHSVPILFTNMVGGNDDLIFDGTALAFGADGGLWAKGAEFAEDLVVVNLETGLGKIAADIDSTEEAALEALTLGVKDYAKKCGFKTAILGLSGGIDSALTAVIGVRALGRRNVKAVTMPSPYSSSESITDSMDLAYNLGIDCETVPIDKAMKEYEILVEPFSGGLQSDTTEENIQARIRGNIIMALSNKFGHLVLSTGNKSEFATGYCTLYGDMAGGLAVLSDVPKTLVYELSRAVNKEEEIIPRNIIDKPPSAELKPNQKDQDTLPPYEILDEIIDRHIVQGMDGKALIEAGYDASLTDSILDMIRNNEYKRRQAPPGLKLTSKAFGRGRRIPIAQRWQP